MKYLSLILLMLVAHLGVAQKIVKQINGEVLQSEYQGHAYFLASDELRGRDTGTPENEIAARYIAERFRAYGVGMVPGSDSYFQQVPLLKEVSPNAATLQVGDRQFQLGEDLVFYTAGNGTFSGELLYVNYGLEEDLEGLDLNGKIVVAKVGSGNPSEPMTPYTIRKQDAVKTGGGVALIELYAPRKYPWNFIRMYFSGDKYQLGSEEVAVRDFPSAWLLDNNAGLLEYFQNQDGEEASLTIEGQSSDRISVPNVVGVLEGSDPKLKDEYVLISAHLDHVGVSPVEGDSIWNGARDNAIGISNMLLTAEFLAKYPPKRSVIFLACNAEEKGLLGSRWYAEHPLIPLEKTVFNLNTDTGGYNDTSIVTIVGYNRTSVSEYFAKAAGAFGLGAIDDPLPEENFYDRSDNVSFAVKGVPAVSFGPGYTEMNEEITKYYHQPADEAHTLDYPYLTKFTKSFIYTTWMVANREEDIFWTAGDKYESAGKALYGR